MNQLIAIILLASILQIIECHLNDDLCIPVRRDAQGPSPTSIQGRPGKIGPPGAVGPVGPKGAKGIPGDCICDFGTIERKIERIRREIEDFNYLLKNVNYEKFCYAGVKDGRVKDGDMSASSVHPNKHYAHYGRLDNPAGDPNGYWHPACTNGGCESEWLQVDFKTPTRIVGVITQGRSNIDQWTTSYKIAYGNSTSSLETIQNNSGSDKIFQGNRDRNTHVTNMFPEPVTARYFRIIVVTYQWVSTLRIEYLVC